jgi:hypothetical protein
LALGHAQFYIQVRLFGFREANILLSAEEQWHAINCMVVDTDFNSGFSSDTAWHDGGAS